MKAIAESDKMSLTECRKLMNIKGKHYTDDQLIKIRNWIYQFAEMTLTHLNEKTPEEIQAIKLALQEKENRENKKLRNRKEKEP